MSKVSPGMRLGRYEVGAPIGAGGMGEVFSGVDTRLGRQVAIKVLPEHVAQSADVRQRFEREAKLLASLSHPNILSIHDFGDEQGITFAVMELLQGETLRQRLRRGSMPVATALEHALGVARGLAAAHAKNVVHRDLKPENVFLPGSGSVKILDFGIARLTESVASQASTAVTTEAFVTQPGSILGTMGYMSPEQLRGHATGPASDVFSFGLMLYEMLTGRAPFSIGSPVDAISAVLNHEAPPLPSALEFVSPIVRICLEKRPERRYRSAQDLVTALEAVTLARSDAPVTSDAAPSVVRQTATRSIAVLPFADLSPSKTLDYLCEGIAEEILLALTKVEGLRVVARSSAFRFKGAAEDLRDVGRALGVDSILEGSVRVAGSHLRVATQLVDAGDGCQMWAERFDRGLDDVFAVQDEIAGAVATTLRVRLQSASGRAVLTPRSQNPEAYRLYLLGRHHWHRRTETDLHRSVEYFTASIALEPAYELAYEGLAEAAVTLGIYGALPPNEAMPMAKSNAERALAMGPPRPGALATLGCVSALYDWSWVDAERQFRQAIDSMPGTSSARAWYAMNLLVPRGRFVEAVDELRRALEVDPLSLAIAIGLGVSAYYAHEYDEAADALARALQLDAGFAMAHYFLGLTFTELGRYDEALHEMERAAGSSEGSPEMTAAAGYAFARSGNLEGARQRLGELTARANTRYVSPGLIAQVHAGLGESDAAIACLEQAMTARAADLAWLGVRPIFDGLRSDSRVQGLMQRLGLRQT